MIYLKYISQILPLFLFFQCGISNAQENQECKVLLTNLSGEYKGECKKGLAHGMGEAKGTDRYVGMFKKGLPSGKGTYYYASGAVYVGELREGKRQGQGTLTFMNDGEQIVEEGIWENDNYIGVKKIKPYEVTLKQNISRYSFIKTTDPRNMVMIKIVRNGSPVYPDNLLLYGTSGSNVQQLPFNGYDLVQFPFNGSIKYSMLNPFYNSSVDYELHYTINDPGSWEITINH